MFQGVAPLLWRGGQSGKPWTLLRPDPSPPRFQETLKELQGNTVLKSFRTESRPELSGRAGQGEKSGHGVVFVMHSWSAVY